MARIICLANSRKHGNRCIAGIDMSTGRLVRPISRLPDGGITEAMWRSAGEDPRILDILELPLEAAGDDYGFQPENKFLGEGPWKKLGRVAPTALFKCCEEGTILLHNRLPRIAWEEVWLLPPSERKSLELIHVADARFYRAETRTGRSQVRVKFTYGKKARYGLVVTDPVIERRILAGKAASRKCMLLVSLGEPFPKDGPAPQCYKLVAGVIEV